MATLIVGLVLFLGVHSLSIVNEPLRNRLHSSLGEGAFKGLYSLVALVGLVLIVWGYGNCPSRPDRDLHISGLAPTPGHAPPDSGLSPTACYLFSGQDQGKTWAPDARRGQALGFGSLTRERDAARSVAVRLFPGLGGGGSDLLETQNPAADCDPAGQQSERCHSRCWWPCGLCGAGNVGSPMALRGGAGVTP